MKTAWVSGKYLALLALLLAVPQSALAQAYTGRDSAEAAFARMDSNHDQLLTPEEFKAGINGQARPVVYQRLPSRFRAVDKDGSGFLEAEEFKDWPMIRNAGADAPSLQSADTSKDAKIDFREFVAVVARLDPAKR